MCSRRRSRELMGEKEKGSPVRRTRSMAASAARRKLLMAEHLEVFGVEGDAVVLLVLVAEDLGGDVFEWPGVVRRCGRGRGGRRDRRARRRFREQLATPADRQALHVTSGRVAGDSGLHLAVAGKDVELQIQTARGGEGLEEVSYLLLFYFRVFHGNLSVYVCTPANSFHRFHLASILFPRKGIKAGSFWS